MEFTTETWMILGLTLALGWLLGLMSRSGGKRWKRELAREREEHKAAIRNRDEQIAALKTRVTDYENARPAAGYSADRDMRPDLRNDSRVDNLDLRHRDTSIRDRDVELETRRNPDGSRTVLPRP